MKIQSIIHRKFHEFVEKKYKVEKNIDYDIVYNTFLNSYTILS